MNEGTAEIPTEMITFWSPTPRVATSERARRKPGNDRRMSASRWITRSVKPPWKPETAPSGTPITRPSPTARKPIMSERRPP
jgi:hypothetical protein